MDLPTNQVYVHEGGCEMIWLQHERIGYSDRKLLRGTMAKPIGSTLHGVSADNIREMNPSSRILGRNYQGSDRSLSTSNCHMKEMTARPICFTFSCYESLTIFIFWPIQVPTLSTRNVSYTARCHRGSCDPPFFCIACSGFALLCA